MKLEKAAFHETGKISELYKSVIGQEGCTWNKYYPSETEIRTDYEAGTLYVYKSGDDIIGTVSVVPENELDDFKEWKINNGNQREIARVAISPEYQGKGLAIKMLAELFGILKENGCSAVHILVAECNKAAISTYKKLGFVFCEEHEMYDNKYFSAELILD